MQKQSRVSIILTPEEREILQKGATLDGIPFSLWLKNLGMRRAQEMGIKLKLNLNLDTNTKTLGFVGTKRENKS